MSKKGLLHCRSSPVRTNIVPFFRGAVHPEHVWVDWKNPHVIGIILFRLLRNLPESQCRAPCS